MTSADRNKQHASVRYVDSAVDRVAKMLGEEVGNADAEMLALIKQLQARVTELEEQVTRP